MTKKNPKPRADGRVQRQVTIVNEVTGQKVVKCLYGYSVRELDLKEQAAKAKYGTTVYCDMTLYEYLEKYIKQRKLELTGVDGLNTLELYEMNFKNHVKGTTIGSTQLMDLNVFMFREFLANIKPRKKGCPGLRLRQELYTNIKTALTEAVYDGWITSNPLDRIKKPDYRSKEKAIVTPEQFDRIMSMAFAENPVIANMFLFDLNNGLRRGEMVALRWTDVDFKKKTVKVTKALKRTKQYGTVQGSPKTHVSDRELLLDDCSINCLRNQLKLAHEAFVKRGEPFKMDSFVFFDDNGDHIKLDYITRKFSRYRDILGYTDRMTLHSLRHTAATFLAENNVGIKAIQLRLGWASPDMPLRVYSHFTNKMQENVVELLNQKTKSVKSLSN